MNHPTLYQRDKRGNVRVWRVWTDGATVCVEHGITGGQMVTQTVECEPKNVGRANQTTAEQQAELEAAAMWRHKRDRKYSETLEETADQRWLPMLAKDYRKVRHIQFPVDVQRKYNGARACAHYREDGTITLRSRQDKDWGAVGHILVTLRSLKVPPGTRLDGELYAHGESLQRTMSFAKVTQPGTEKLKYMVYDVPEYSYQNRLEWRQRREALKTLNAIIRQAGVGDVIQVAHTWEDVTSMDEVLKLQKAFVCDGYEGAMIRTHAAEYEQRVRSSHLLKVKDFQDAEFEVVGFKAEKFTTNGATVLLPVWQCITPEGKDFDVRPTGTVEERAELYRTAEDYLGKRLTVKFFDYTDEGKPFLPVGLGFRPSEDL